MRLRKIVFWCHFAAGVVAGLVIAVMSLTGAVLAFEKEMVSFAERGVRRIRTETDSAAGDPMTLARLLDRVRADRPEFRTPAVTLFAGEVGSVLVTQGRTNAVYVDGRTGEIVGEGALGLRRFLQTMIEWHRWLAAGGESRAVGKTVTGACNLAFLVLALTGVYLWWPRKWNVSAVRAVSWFQRGLKGRARDWNWHNVIGLWTGPVLVVLTATALPISYRWAGDLLQALSGDAAGTAAAATPPRGGAGMGRGPDVGAGNAAGGSGTEPASMRLDALRDLVATRVPAWREITLRTGGGPGPGGGREGVSSRERAGRGAAAGEAAANLAVTVKERGAWPRFATVQLRINPISASIVAEEGYASLPRGRRARMWTRFLHTGEALGPVGQAIAGLASLGGVVLTWTGFALAWRRVVPRRSKTLMDPACAERAETASHTTVSSDRRPDSEPATTP